MPDQMPERQKTYPQQGLNQRQSEQLNFARLSFELIEKAKSERPEHLEFSAEGCSREDAVQSAILKHVPTDPEAAMTREDYEALAAIIAEQVRRDEARALRSNARHQAIARLNREQLAQIAQDPNALRIVIGRQAMATVKASLPRDANLHRVLDSLLPRDGTPASLHWRETRGIAAALALDPDDVERHKEAIRRVVRRVLSEKLYFSD